MDLTEFLLARIAEDEKAAHQIAATRDRFGLAQEINAGMPGHPARVLAECEAKRRIVRQWENYDGDSLWGFDVLRLLALPYADHPDYRQEWRP